MSKISDTSFAPRARFVLVRVKGRLRGGTKPNDVMSRSDIARLTHVVDCAG
jgi:hypothetical protein